MIRTTFIRAALCAATLVSPASRALQITDPVVPPSEACDVDLAPYFRAPDVLRACPNGNSDANCGRLIEGLRNAARTADAQEILIRSAFEFYLLRHSELLPADARVAQALADLSVTGRAAYASFRRLIPSEATLTDQLRQRLMTIFPAHVQDAGEVAGAAQQTLSRAYQVAWAIRGPTPYRGIHRSSLGWIAVDAEDDPPHRPVNIASAPYPQIDMNVRVDGIDVQTRYTVASPGITDNHPVNDIRNIPPETEHPLIVGDVVLFIHGHSSSAEEAVTITRKLHAQSVARGRPVTVIAMDLPSNGYASMIEHTEVAPSDASRWNTGYPILDFYEKFIIAFVDGLDARQPGLKNQITVVIGGSLGGNMTLRLARRDPATYPWLRRVVSWSPASSWPSWESQPPTDLRHIAAFGAGVRMVMPEGTDTLDEFFFGVGGRNRQSDEWYSASWPCRQNAVTASHRGIYEIYNTRFRRWHWRVAYEQVIYSHWDSDNPNPAIGPARYSRIRSKMLFATGYNDNNSPVWLFTEARQLARAMTMVEGTGLMVAATGHSIDTEKPAFFAGRILDFLYEAPVPPFPFFLNPSTTIDR